MYKSETRSISIEETVDEHVEAEYKVVDENAERTEDAEGKVKTSEDARYKGTKYSEARKVDTLKKWLRLVHLALRLPGPPATPFFGNIFMLRDGTKFLQFLIDARRYNKSLVRGWISLIPIVGIGDPKHIQTILASTKQTDKSFPYTFMHTFLGQGLLTNNGNKWKLHRKYIQPYFHKSVLKQFIKAFTESSDLLVEQLHNKQEVNITKYINNCVLNILHCALFGIPVRDHDAKLNSPFNKGHLIMIERLKQPWYIFDFVYKFSSFSKHESTQKSTMQQFAKEILDQRRQGLGKSEWCLLDSFIEISEKYPRFDKTSVVEEICTFMLAGQDSVGAAVAFALYCLGKHPEVQQKVVEELDKVFKEHSEITMENLYDLVYLRQCIKESLRLYPSVPLISRELGEDVNLGRVSADMVTTSWFTKCGVGLSVVFLLILTLLKLKCWLRCVYLAFNLPGPHPAILWGNRKLHSSEAVKVFKCLHKLYGPLAKVWITFIPFIIISDPNCIKAVLGSAKQIDKNLLYGFLSRFFGMGLLTSSDKRRQSKSKLNWSLLDYLINVSKTHPEFGDEDIVDHICTFMLSGQDTVAGAISFTLYNLAKHPEVQQKVVDELEQIFEKHPKVDMNSLNQMVYLEQCINESLRLFPSIPLISKKLVEDVQLAYLIVSVFKLRYWARGVRLVFNLPRPTAVPLFGNVLMMKNTNEFLNFMMNLKCPLTGGWIAVIPVVIILDPKYVHKILSNTKETQKNFLYTFMDTFLGEGLLTTSGALLGIHIRDYETLQISPFNKGHLVILERLLQPWYILDRIYRLSSISKYESTQRLTLKEFAKKILDQRRKDVGKNEWCFLDSLIKVSENNPRFTDENIVDEICTFMLAGQDSVGSAISFTLYNLAKHPEVQQNVVDELDAVFRDHAEINMESLNKMVYMEQCIKESLRLYPSVPIISKKLVEDVQLDNHILPKGLNVLIPLIGIHRLEEYHPSPNKFKPERFSPSNQKDLSPYAFVPFSAGTKELHKPHLNFTIGIDNFIASCVCCLRYCDPIRAPLKFVSVCKWKILIVYRNLFTFKERAMNPMAVKELLFKDQNYVDVFNNNVSYNLRSKVSETWGLFAPLNGYDQHYTNYVNRNECKVPTELIVTNLDPTIAYMDLWTILLNIFKQFAKVLNVSVNVQPDGSLAANVKVSSQQEAQLAIAQLNHQWVGGKRILISHLHSIPDYNEVRFIIISLLQNVPGNQMPLFKFFELVRSRYHTSVSVSEVNRLKNVCKIMDGPNGRTIRLTQEASVCVPLQYENSPQPFCSTHCPNGLEIKGWEGVSLPNLRILLKVFQDQVTELLSSHNGVMPLLSFPVCYSVHFKKPLPEDNGGIPLEHLLTCVSNIEIITSNNNKNVKYVRMVNVKDGKMKEPEDPLTKTVPAPFIENVSLLCRQIGDLLKTVDQCQLLITRFVPTYHHHFGRQCRLADYGFTKLTDLFEAISHCVQILGYGEKKMITLTHTVQVRRFTSDLLRVLKGQALQRVSLGNFPVAYEKVFHKSFNPTDYGLCELEDLLAEISEGTVTVSKVDEVYTIAIPKREQTPEQIERTNQFRSEIEEFLCQSPYCSILFDKFIPAYHRHFARQCKVSDYGFTKLVELFEAIPETVEVEEVSDTERRVKLKLHTALEVLGGQIRSLILQSNLSTLLIDEMIDIFKQTHGYTLKSIPYQCRNLTELVLKLDSFVQVTYSRAGPLLSVINVDNQVLEIHTWALLRHPPHECTVNKFKYEYRIKFLTNAPVRQLDDLKTVLKISQDGDEQIISLTPMYILCAHLYQMLYEENGTIELNKVTELYFKKYGSTLSAKNYRVNSLDNLFRQMKFLINYQKNDGKVFLVLNKNLRNFGVPVPNVPRHSETWPPIPAHLHLGNLTRITPPKPDTPPPLGSLNPNANYSKENGETLKISIPEFGRPKFDINDGLISSSAFGVFFPSPWSRKIGGGGGTELVTGKNTLLDDSGYYGFNNFGQESPINSANW
ncbi:hypothetical protein RI129_009351 [Pyrocoelia pectoralis]|uniref:HTH OST-type domain-containing protein n=1 Tax=Pyrocoelia pectoralis TaxID=417401 RepID=A0AAN7VCC4_9COLE